MSGPFWVALLLLAVVVGGIDASRQEELRKCVCHDAVTQSPCVGHADGCKKYGMAVGIAAAIPLVVFFVMFWGLWCFGCMRGCCHWCGDSRPRSGCCLAGDEPHHGYAGREVTLFRVSMVLTLVIAVAVGIPSLESNEKITTGIKDLGRVLDNLVTVSYRAIDVVEQETTRLIDIPPADKATIASESTARRNIGDITSFKDDFLGMIAIFTMHGCHRVPHQLPHHDRRVLDGCLSGQCLKSVMGRCLRILHSLCSDTDPQGNGGLRTKAATSGPTEEAEALREYTTDIHRSRLFLCKVEMRSSRLRHSTLHIGAL
eukprot:TRINITY_DN251_c0_g1_i3.p1 TRINITY_DN251_c0_g1~~TRINITY_DN251_c0_g1_i3.p1  ORF type:complete len:331 (+),score=38.40 TRINITY_DN251_c0_g1_i3:50-994(+)